VVYALFWQNLSKWPTYCNEGLTNLTNWTGFMKPRLALDFYCLFS